MTGVEAGVERVKRGVLEAAMGLPAAVQRRLAGAPVRIDGLTLDTDVQLMLRLQEVAREKGAETLPLAQGREAVRRHARLTVAPSRSAACAP